MCYFTDRPCRDSDVALLQEEDWARVSARRGHIKGRRTTTSLCWYFASRKKSSRLREGVGTPPRRAHTLTAPTGFEGNKYTQKAIKHDKVHSVL